jgi:hypothetical protein
MSENVNVYFIPIEEPRMDSILQAVQSGIKFLDEFCRESKESKDVILYVWSTQDIPYYFKQSFNQEAIKMLTNGKTLRGNNSKIKHESYNTFSLSSGKDVIFSAYPNKKMLDNINEALDRDLVKSVIIVHYEKEIEPWLNAWASYLVERIE